MNENERDGNFNGAEGVENLSPSGASSIDAEESINSANGVGNAENPSVSAAERGDNGAQYSENGENPASGSENNENGIDNAAKGDREALNGAAGGFPSEPLDPYALRERPLADGSRDEGVKTPLKAKKILTAVLSLALCMVFGFFGAAGGIYLLAQTGFADTNSMLGNMIIGSSGLEVHKVTVNETELAYSGGFIECSEKVMPSVVEVYELKLEDDGSGSYRTVGSASGVILSDTGYIVTNQHVTDGVDALSIVLWDGTEYQGRVIAEDAMTDLALVKIEPSEHPEKTLTAATFGVSENLKSGQSVVAVGNPLGVGLSVSSGIISAPLRDVNVDGEVNKLIQMTAAVSPGNSGGGMFDLYGNLIGIVNAKTTGEGVEGMGYAIPVSTVKTVLDDLMKYGYVKGRPFIGITVASVYDKNTYDHYAQNELQGYLFQTRYGLYVVENTGTSDLKKGDRIIEFDGVKVTGSATISEALGNHKPGDTVTVKVQRLLTVGGTEFEELVINVTLVEKKP